ncbi:MAG: PAS domain S-box protein [Magnetococcales bacterium]|nr:PAS domain S-box protein [Magnetococcales bacterium]
MRDVSILIFQIDNDFDHALVFMERFLRTHDHDAGTQAVALMEGIEEKTQQLEKHEVFSNWQGLVHVREQVDAQLHRFQQMREKDREIGFTEDAGEYGRIRGKIHQIEDLLAQGRQFELLNSVLQLRRHEKDFFSRKKDEYLKKFDTEMERLHALVNNAPLTMEEKDNLQIQFTQYDQGFHNIVSRLSDIEELNTASQSGILHVEMALSELEETLNLMYKAHDINQTNLLFDQFVHSQIIVLVALLLIGFLLAWSQYDVLSTINILSNVARRVSIGEDCELSLNRRDEIGKLACSLKTMKNSLMERHRKLAAKVMELEESEKKYAAVIQLAGDPIVSLDAGLRIISWNRGAEDCFGYDEATITGQMVTRLLDGSSQQKVEQAVRATRMDGKFRVLGIEGDLYCQRSDGERFPVSLSLSTWEMDATHYFTVIARDISERMAEQRQIERAMDRRAAISEILQRTLQPITLHEMLGHALDIVLNIPWLGLEQRGAIFLYDKATERLELVVQRSLSSELLALCHRIPVGYCLCGRAAASKEVVMSHNVDDRHDVHFSGMSSHGHYCVPILFDQQCLGVLNMYLPVDHVFDNEEIGFLKNVANTLAGLIYRHSADRKVTQLSRALEQSPVSILITDNNGSIEYVNPRFSGLTGYAQEELIGMDVLKLKFGDEKFDKQIFDKIINNGWDWSGELRSRKKTGELFWESVSLAPVLDMEQHITNFIFVSEDITEKMALKAAQDHLLITLDAKVMERTQELNQKIEELETTRHELIAGEKMASLGRLVAGFAHEINTPVGIGVSTISSIPASVAKLEHMLEQDEVDEADLSHCLTHIRDSAILGLANMRRAADLVTRFKRTSVDQSSESQRRFNVRETLNDVVVSLHNTFKTSRIAIELDGPDELMVFSQPGSLGQIFTNLLMNSFKHGFENGQRAGTINIRYSVEGSPSGHLHFWYRDNGRGIEASHLKKLFEPFFTTARESGGSGLGTFIIYNIVTDQLKGKIDVSSVTGEGTLFYFYFPVYETGGIA